MPIHVFQSISLPFLQIGLFGGLNSTTAIVTLSSPAADDTVVNLTSSNPSLVSVPASVTITPGATSASFTAKVLTNVQANTAVTISAVLQGVTAKGTLTVLAGTDRITLTKAEYSVSKRQWNIEVTDSDQTNSRIDVLTTTGVDLDSLQIQGKGKFKGQGTAPPPLTTVVLQSFKGGATTIAVVQLK